MKIRVKNGETSCPAHRSSSPPRRLTSEDASVELSVLKAGLSFNLSALNCRVGELLLSVTDENSAANGTLAVQGREVW